MSGGVFGFKTQLRYGQLGEVIFYEANCKDVIRLDGKEGDFAFKDTGAKLELKTDYYAMDKTPNFFFERYSNKDKLTPGGPWQAMEHGATEFVYFYVSNLTYFRFQTAQLVERLEEIVPTLSPTDIQNKSHVTQGYRVPRGLVADLGHAYSIKMKSKKEKSG